MHGVSRKEKMYSCIERIFCILCINLMTFYLREMTWTVLSNKLRSFGADALLECLSNFLIFLMTMLVITYFFAEKNRFATAFPFFRLFILKILPRVIGIRLLTDAVASVANAVSPVLSAILLLPAEAASLFWIFSTIKKQTASADSKADGIQLRFLIGGALWTAACTVAYICKMLSSMTEMTHITEKYRDSAFLYDATTADFELQSISLLCSIGLWIFLFACFDLLYSHDAKNGRRRGALFIARVFAIIAIALAAGCVKAMPLPHGVLSRVEAQRKEGIYYTDEKAVHDHFAVVTCKRKTGYDTVKTVYKNTRVILTCGNEPILRFSRSMNQDIGTLVMLETPEVDLAYRYDFDAIAYVHDGMPFAIKCRDIDHYSQKDTRLIAICEQLIDDGWFEAFEYSYKYLLRYDKAYVEAFMSKTVRMNGQFLIPKVMHTYNRHIYHHF